MTSEKEISEETEKKISQLQMYEQSIQSFLAQKNQFQAQLMEIESALSELEKTNAAYKIIGSVMVLSKKEDLKTELESKKEVLQLRINAMEKQEKQVKEKTTKLQSEILNKLNASSD